MNIPRDALTHVNPEVHSPPPASQAIFRTSEMTKRREVAPGRFRHFF